jgi:hypothetical protein
MKAFECTGQWWLPGDEQHGVAGTLKVSQSGELRLKLFGMLGSEADFQSKMHPVILGWVEESPLGDRVVTLTGCVIGSRSVGSHLPTRENYRAASGFFGGHLAAQADFLFKNMSLRLAGLSEWAHVRTGFGDERISVGAGERQALLTYAYVSPLEAAVPGGRLSLGVGMSSEGRHRERLFQEEVELSVFSEVARSTYDLNVDFVYPLQNLMTFVSDRPQEVEDFLVRPGEFPENLGGRGIHVIGVRVQPEEDGDGPEPVHHAQMLFTLADVDFTDFMGKWLHVTRRFLSACNAFFGVQYGPPAFIDMAFPYVVQSLYLYYAQREDGVAGRGEEEGRLKEILASLVPADADWIVDRLGVRPFPPLFLVLRKLVEEHGHVMNPLLSHRQERFVSEVVNTSKYVAFRETEMGQAASHGADLYWMMQRLRFLFKSCLMQELGFPKDKVKTLFDRNGLYQYLCQIEETEERKRQKA